MFLSSHLLWFQKPGTLLGKASLSAKDEYRVGGAGLPGFGQRGGAGRDLAISQAQGSLLAVWVPTTSCSSGAGWLAPASTARTRKNKASFNSRAAEIWADIAQELKHEIQDFRMGA